MWKYIFTFMIYMYLYSPVAIIIIISVLYNVHNVPNSYRKEGNVLFNDALNTFYIRLYGVRHMVEDHSDNERGNPLPPHGYSFRLAARVLLYASSHRQDNTYHGICYTSRGALAGTRNCSMGPPHECSYHGATSRSKTATMLQVVKASAPLLV